MIRKHAIVQSNYLQLSSRFFCKMTVYYCHNGVAWYVLPPYPNINELMHFTGILSNISIAITTKASIHSLLSCNIPCAKFIIRNITHFLIHSVISWWGHTCKTVLFTLTREIHVIQVFKMKHWLIKDEIIVI